MARFVIVPQWQGSPSARAMQLIDGAQAIAGDLPRTACVPVEVALEAGEALASGVDRYSALARTAPLVREQCGDAPSVVIGGDCSVSVPAIGEAASRRTIAVVWLDAHADFHTPQTSPSRAFAGMALRAVLGDGPDGLALAPGTVRPEHVILAGARDIEPAEETSLAELGVATLTANQLTEPASLAEAVAATGAEAVYVHVDLDVLDPAAMTGVTAPVPFGVAPADLISAIGAVRERLPLAGATIAGFAPRTPADAVDDMGAILRIVGALA